MGGRGEEGGEDSICTACLRIKRILIHHIIAFPYKMDDKLITRLSRDRFSCNESICQKAIITLLLL